MERAIKILETGSREYLVADGLVADGLVTPQPAAGKRHPVAQSSSDLGRPRLACWLRGSTTATAEIRDGDYVIPVRWFDNVTHFI